jgi:hypothetical protein
MELSADWVRRPTGQYKKRVITRVKIPGRPQFEKRQNQNKIEKEIGGSVRSAAIFRPYQDARHPLAPASVCFSHAVKGGGGDAVKDPATSILPFAQLRSE